MRNLFSTLALALWAGSSTGCSQSPAVVPLDALRFPVVVVSGTHPSNALPVRADVVTSHAELGRMRQGIYTIIHDQTRTDPPIVIDASAAAFDMKGIRGKHGGLWLMANPTSPMPIRFTLLARDKSGIEAARAIIASSDYMGPDIDEARTKLRAARILRANSMAEIIAIVDEIPAVDGRPRPRPFEPID